MLADTASCKNVRGALEVDFLGIPNENHGALSKDQRPSGNRPMSNTDTTHQFSPAEVVKISAIVQRKLAATIPALINEAISDVIGMRTAEAPSTEPTKARILKTLSEAPQHAPQHPAESRFMACHAMTKTTLRRFIGNSTPGFAQALAELTQTGQVVYTKTIGAKGRLLHVYGLPEQPRENPEH